MNIFVIGLGSMGKRRIRLVHQLYPQYAIIGVDGNEERRREVMKLGVTSVYDRIEAALEENKISAAFVCTSPLAHKHIILQLLKQNIHVFTELNLVTDGYPEIINRQNQETIAFLSSTLLYRKDIEYIKKRVENQTVNYLYHSGQYLPDWHPWENYKNFFVGDKRTNGCREILAIDLPWIVQCFGKIIDFHVVKSKMTTLDINYNDNYMISIQHENGSKGCFFADVISRKATRKLEVFSEQLHIFWEGTPQSLYEYDINSKIMQQIETYESISKDNSYCDNIIENAYMEEIQTFFESIRSGKDISRYDFRDDNEILNLINRIEEE